MWTMAFLEQYGNIYFTWGYARIPLNLLRKEQAMLVKEKYTEKRRMYLEDEISKCQDIITRERGRISELQHELFILGLNRGEQLKG